MDLKSKQKKLYLTSLTLWSITFILWVALWFFNPYAQAESITMAGLVMFAVAVSAIIASIFKMALPLLALSLVSFVPIGLYLLGTPGIFMAIGVVNFLNFILASILLLTNVRQHGSSVVGGR